MDGKEMIKLICINIEMKRRLNSVRAFLARQRPDVICLQEVYQEDLEALGKEFGMEIAFGQMTLMSRDESIEPPLVPYGIGLLSRVRMTDIHRLYYRGDEQSVREYAFKGSPYDFYRLLLYATFRKGNSEFVIGTTHFTWTPDGEADDLQRNDLVRLLAILKEIPELVFCGDLNAPRGQEIFDTIARSYRDNIPSHYTTSIDVNLHRVGEKLRGRSLMIDGLFSTPEYRCLSVRLQDGVSDHMAIVADISK